MANILLMCTWAMMSSSAPPLSYSGIAAFQQCPHKFYRMRIACDVRDSPHPAATWGSDVHFALEQYIRDGVPMPAHLAMYEKYAADLRKFASPPGRELYVEKKLAVDAAYSPVDFDDPAARYRGIVDYLVISGERAYLLDHKTGKIRPSDQLALNAILVFGNFPLVQRIDAAFYWLSHRTYTRYIYERRHMCALDEQLFAPIVEQVCDCLASGVWTKRQSGLCKYCPVEDCEFKV